MSKCITEIIWGSEEKCNIAIESYASFSVCLSLKKDLGIDQNKYHFEKA